MITKVSENVKRLAVMAHDLKAPLSAVVDLLNIIEKGYVDDPNKVKELISRARQKSEIVIKMVEDILDYTLLESQSKMSREKLDIFTIIEESVSIIRPYAIDRKISLDYGRRPRGEKYVNGVRTFLLRAFNNIMMNAVKYNKENGTIDINCFENSNRTVTVEIKDTGIGIPKKDLKNVFDIFSRGSQAGKSIDGSIGLGLAIVKQIIKDHNGSIHISSTPGVGTTVTIKLPLVMSNMARKKMKKFYPGRR